jgi:hypothetical protein
MQDIDRYTNSEVSKLIVGNKTDLSNQRRIDYETGKLALQELQ